MAVQLAIHMRQAILALDESCNTCLWHLDITVYSKNDHTCPFYVSCEWVRQCLRMHTPRYYYNGYWQRGDFGFFRPKVSEWAFTCSICPSWLTGFLTCGTFIKLGCCNLALLNCWHSWRTHATWNTFLSIWMHWSLPIHVQERIHNWLYLGMSPWKNGHM